MNTRVLSTLKLTRLDSAGQPLLDAIDLDVHGGDQVAIIGTTGSGKTLLLRSLALLDPIDAGEILWREARVQGSAVPEFRRQVIYLQQRPALFEGTVEDNIRLPYTLAQHRRESFDIERVSMWLEALGRDAPTFLQRQHHELSGGEAQIVALIRAMQLDPMVFLLDEPTAALDSTSTRAVEMLLHSWRDEDPESRAWLWVSHDLDQAQRLTTRLLRMRSGRLEEERI